MFFRLSDRLAKSAAMSVWSRMFWWTWQWHTSRPICYSSCVI